MDIKKSKYEISIWQDIFTIKDNIKYPDEERLATIGSNTMTSPARALSPSFRENVNGTKTLSFMMYTNYFDDELDKYVANPFIKLLVNERKIKLRVENEKIEWYDLVITNIQENSENNSFIYTATDLHINELAKNGFNLEFDNELENNQGTVNELAEKVLEGTDWTVKKENSDKIIQYKYEPVYQWITTKDITLINILDNSKEIIVPAGGYVYVFYTANTMENFQCIFNNNFTKITSTETLTKEYYSNYTLKTKVDFSNFIKNTTVEPFQAERVVDSIKSGYDAKIDKYYNVYKKNGIEYYCYSESEFISPETVQELIIGGNDFTSTGGWSTTVHSDIIYNNLVLPEANVDNIQSNINFESFLEVQFLNNNDILFNDGLIINRDIINGFNIGDVYHIILNGFLDKDLRQTIESHNIGAAIYKKDGDSIESIIDFGIPVLYNNGEEDVWLYTAAIDKVITLKELESGNYKIGFTCNTNTEQFVYFKTISLFKEVKKSDGTLILPKDVLGLEESYIITNYFIYNPNIAYNSLEDLTYEYTGQIIPDEYEKVSNEYEKIRSLSAKESNRYNLIQTLAELFECWARFTIEHDENTGKILLDADNNYKQKKYVSFHNYVNDDYNYTGFKKGINLTSTTRDVVSDQIVSKLIVKNNANEFATDGFCSIARSNENYLKENYIYNFDYYTSHGLIDGNQLFADLYNPNGYYSTLRQINLLEDPQIEKISEVGIVLTQLESQLQTSKLAYEAAEDELADVKNELYNYCSIRYENLSELDKESPYWENLEFINIITQIKIHEQAYNTNLKQYKLIEEKLQTFQNEYDNLNNELKEYAKQKEELNNQFFSKYSRFIKEGTWISEDYYDDNLYYLDAEKVLFESAYPKISYTIQVIDLSQLEEFKHYKFELGQKSFIEDTDFFGWYLNNGILTPKKEEIIISELIRYFEEPERNIITVQNYKARYDELFQRITATTQSLQYHSGEYGRAANVVESSGEIKYDTLQNSISNNALIIKNAKDNSVVMGDNGITVTNLSRPNEIVRIVSGGVLISDNGGQSYNSAIRGSGINATYITAGQINTERVNIMMGSYPSFKWDKRGINAFWFLEHEDGNTEFNINKFVRFDRFGLYGCNLPEGSDFAPKNLQEVKDNARFGLTWDGFFLKSNSSDTGSLEITSEQDLRVKQDGVNRVELGLLENGKYGLRLKNANNETTLETRDNGNLWLSNRLNIEVANSGNNVGIGTLDVIDDEHGREVINATDEFVVYEDGHMKATSGEFTGTIYATGGKIGNLTIGDVENVVEESKGIEIQSAQGFNFKIDENYQSFPAELILTIKSSGFNIESDQLIKWYGSNDFVTWEPLASYGLNYTLNYENFKNKFLNGTYYIKAEYIGATVYNTYVTIHAISDGITPIYIVVESVKGDIYINNDINTTLIAKAFRGNEEVTNKYPYSSYSWTKYDENGNIDEEWTSLHKNYGISVTITHLDIERRAKFTCDLEL